MKKIIIIAGCIMLGCYIFTLLIGNQSDSFKNMQRQIMESQIQGYKTIP